jgi:hypothetical protein
VEKQIQKKKISGEPDPQPVDKSAVCVRKKKLFWKKKQRKKACSASGYINPYLPAFDVAAVVLLVHEWPADVTRRCRPRPRPRRDSCSAWRLRHLLRAENNGFKKHQHGRSMWEEGGWSDPTAKVIAEVYAVREHEAWDRTSSATRRRWKVP